jgi:hypothetical protein
MKIDELVAEIETLRALNNRRNDRQELANRLNNLKRRILSEGVDSELPEDAQVPLLRVRPQA